VKKNGSKIDKNRMNSREKTMARKRHSLNQCCETVKMYCGSGSSSYFRKVLVPVPILVPVPVPFSIPGPDMFSTVYQQQKFVQNLAFTMLEAALFPRKLASNF
jgi:hypothetical protein